MLGQRCGLLVAVIEPDDHAAHHRDRFVVQEHSRQGMHAAASEPRDTKADADLCRRLELAEKVTLDMRQDQAVFDPETGIIADQRFEIGNPRRLVVGEVHRIVHMPEGVHVAPAHRHFHHMTEIRPRRDSLGHSSPAS